MAERAYTIIEALEILKSSLERCGLARMSININTHNLTPAKSWALVRDLLAGGFGDAVLEAGQTFQYGFRPGSYSWLTVEQGSVTGSTCFTISQMKRRLSKWL